jgi:hypothetical protein
MRVLAEALGFGNAMDEQATPQVAFCTIEAGLLL